MPGAKILSQRIKAEISRQLSSVIVEKGLIDYDDPDLRPDGNCTFAATVYVAVPEKKPGKRCNTCEHYGWDMPQCRDCTDENGRRWHSYR